MNKLARAAFAVLALAGPAAAQAPGEPANFKPPMLREVGFDQNLGDKVPLDITLKDEQGRDVRLGDYFGKKPVVLALVYYECPMLCSQILNGVVSALDILKFDAGKEFDVIAVSFNPKEGPGLASAKKRAYTERYKRPGTEHGWHFLTGTPESIAQLTTAVGFRYAWDAKTEQYAHAAGIMVLTPEGRIAKYHYGVEYSPRDLRLALVEASSSRIGNAVDQVLLYCYHYDPTTGQYGLAAMTAVRLGGVATIAGMLTFWIVMWRRERREPDAPGRV